MLVDLFTYDRELASVILGDFPGKIIPDEQYWVDDSEPGVRIYCFYQIVHNEIKEFLKSHPGDYELKGEKGQIIEVRKHDNLDRIQESFYNPN